MKTKKRWPVSGRGEYEASEASQPAHTFLERHTVLVVVVHLLKPLEDHGLELTRI